MIDSKNGNPSQLYMDFNQFNDLRKLSRDDEDQALLATAKQMEGVFVNMMLQSMREANALFAEGNLFDSSDSQFYQSMYDKQLSQDISAGPGIGLAEVIVRQMSQQSKSPDLSSLPESFDVTASMSHRLPALYQRNIDPDENEDSKPVTIKESSTNDSLKNEEASPIWQTPEQFVEFIYPHAEKAAQKLNVDPEAVVAQAVLETGWGQHVMPASNGDSSFNLFGIKANGSWAGDVTRKSTVEYRNGIAAKENAPFRSYGSLDTAFDDYVNFLKNNSRYDSAVNKNIEAKQWGFVLQEAGYATDPKYGNKIASILESDVLQSAINNVKNRL